MALNFSSPIFLFGLLAASAPILIHLLTRRQQTHIKFSAVYLLLQSQKRSIKRSRPNRFLLLLFRCLAIAFLSLGLAHPLYSSGTANSSLTEAPSVNVIILDNSYSMGWKSEKGTVFQSATEIASRIISQLPEGSTTYLILTSNPNKLVEGSGNKPTMLLKKLKFAQPSFLKTDIGSTISTAAETLESSKLKEKRLHIITDGDKNAWGDESKFSDIGDRIRSSITNIYDLGFLRRGSNQSAVKKLDIRQEFLTNSKVVRVKTEIANLTENKPIKTLHTKLHVNQKILSESTVDISPNATTIKEFSFPQLGIEPALGFVELEEDSLLADNRKYFSYLPNRKIQVLAVDGDPKTVSHQSETFYLERALNPFYGSHSDFEPTISTLEELPSKDLQEFSVVFLCNVRELSPGYEFELERFVNGGGSLFISLGDQVDPKFYNEKLGNLIPVNIQNIIQSKRTEEAFKLSLKTAKHPVFEGFTETVMEEMETIKFHSFFQIESRIRKTYKVPIYFSSGAPATIETDFGNGIVILFLSTADRDWNNFPIQPTFLPWIQRWVKYASNGLNTFSHGDLFPGEPFFLGEATENNHWIQTPGNKTYYYKKTNKGFQNTFRPGIYRIFSNSQKISEKYLIENETKLPPESELVGTFSINIDFRESISKTISENEIKSLLSVTNLNYLKHSDSLEKPNDMAAKPLTIPLLLMAAISLCIEGWIVRKE